MTVIIANGVNNLDNGISYKVTFSLSLNGRSIEDMWKSCYKRKVRIEAIEQYPGSSLTIIDFTLLDYIF
jgi:hypothetical protein